MPITVWGHQARAITYRNSLFRQDIVLVGWHLAELRRQVRWLMRLVTVAVLATTATVYLVLTRSIHVGKWSAGRVIRPARTRTYNWAGTPA